VKAQAGLMTALWFFPAVGKELGPSGHKDGNPCGKAILRLLINTLIRRWAPSPGGLLCVHKFDKKTGN